MCKWKRINLYKPEFLIVISLLGIQGGLRGVPQIISCTFNFTGFFSIFTVKQQSQTKLKEKLLHDYFLPVFIFYSTLSKDLKRLYIFGGTFLNSIFSFDASQKIKYIIPHNLYF